MQNVAQIVMLNTDGANERQNEKNAKNAPKILFVRDHGKNTLKCMVGKNLYR